MIATERLISEEQFHDRQAEERAEYFVEHRGDLVFADDTYLEHETWIQPAFAQLGDVRGKDVLDYGCGHGMASVVLARSGASVTGFDLSTGYIAEARARAAANQVSIQFQQADAEELPFADNSFDAVWGCAILHHLDLARAGRELRRVLRPGGVAVFCEPWGGNPILNFARGKLPYPGKHRTPDEAPLRKSDLRPLEAIFPNLQVRGSQLLGMFRRILSRQPRPVGWLDRCDQRLLRRFPTLENWCRYAVITLS
ncbi:MAG: class I SAM-dependent methyltransferase [Planctomycetes bacterium]|nr:class I SAM-dependent methyltransferase [Planctomycetota bacterium]